MGQVEIIEVLKKAGKPLTASEIAEILEERIQKILKYIPKLIKSNEIVVVEIDKDKAYEKFNSKRKMRLYYYL